MLNSVAVVFIMDIDNFAREAFQSESISEHVDAVEFNTMLFSPPEDKSEGISHREITLENIMTFWSLEKAAVVVLLTAVLVFFMQGFNC